MPSYAGLCPRRAWWPPAPNFCCWATVKSLLFEVARYSFSRSIPLKFERKVRRHKQRFGKIDTTVVLDKDENLL